MRYNKKDSNMFNSCDLALNNGKPDTKQSFPCLQTNLTCPDTFCQFNDCSGQCVTGFLIKPRGFSGMPFSKPIQCETPRTTWFRNSVVYVWVASRRTSTATISLSVAEISLPALFRIFAWKGLTGCVRRQN